MPVEMASTEPKRGAVGLQLLRWELSYLRTGATSDLGRGRSLGWLGHLPWRARGQFEGWLRCVSDCRSRFPSRDHSTLHDIDDARGDSMQLDRIGCRKNDCDAATSEPSED